MPISLKLTESEITSRTYKDICARYLGQVTQELLHELFYYHEDGYLCRKLKTSGKVVIGERFGTISRQRGDKFAEKAYYKGALFGKMYYVHRLIWLFHHGTWPVGLLDHDDHNTLNNRIGNLVKATPMQNSRNQNRAINNTTGYTGIQPAKKAGSYIAQIHVAGRNIRVGTFTSMELAVAARKQKEIELGFHPNHGITNPMEQSC